MPTVTAAEAVADLVFGTVIDHPARADLVIDMNPLGVDPGDDNADWTFTAFDVLVVTGEVVRVECRTL